MIIEKVTTSNLLEMKEKGEKITMLTAYDYLMASQLDECGGGLCGQCTFRI